MADTLDAVRLLDAQRTGDICMKGSRSVCGKFICLGRCKTRKGSFSEATADTEANLEAAQQGCHEKLPSLALNSHCIPRYRGQQRLCRRDAPCGTLHV
eukprot:scaffold1314_cov393-Prasinococcus_capsulatus_cf.AAC.8